MAKPKEKAKAKIKELIAAKESITRIARTLMLIINQITVLLPTRNSERNRKKELVRRLSHLS